MEDSIRSWCDIFNLFCMAMVNVHCVITGNSRPQEFCSLCSGRWIIYRPARESSQRAETLSAGQTTNRFVLTKYHIY